MTIFEIRARRWQNIGTFNASARWQEASADRHGGGYRRNRKTVDCGRSLICRGPDFDACGGGDKVVAHTAFSTGEFPLKNGYFQREMK